MNRRFTKACSVLAILAASVVSAAEDVQWVRVTVLLETGTRASHRIEDTLVPGGVYSLAEVKERGMAPIDGEILKRIRSLGESMRSVESSMRLATLLARQYYLPLEVGRKAVLPVIDLNPRLGIVFTPQRFLNGRMDCQVQFLEPAGLLDPPEFTGDPITLRLHDADLRDVLKTFSKLLEIEIVVDPAVSGKVTVDLREIPWDQALDLVLRVNNLGWERVGDTLRVGPLDEMSRRKRVRTDATINLPRRTWGSATLASRGDEYNPTVVLYVESVDGPPALAAERDGLVHPTRVMLVDLSPDDLEDSVDELAVFRATVSTDGRLRDPVMLASPSKAYAERLTDVLGSWRLSSVLDEQGRRLEAVVGFGIRFRPQRVLVSSGDVEHLGVEISTRPVSDGPGLYVIRAKVTDLDTGELVSAPRVTAKKGDEANLRTGFVAPSGEPTTLEMSFLISEDGKTIRYSWTLTREGKVLSSHQAEFGL